MYLPCGGESEFISQGRYVVPEQSQKDRVFWEQVSWKGNEILDVWPQARPYLRFSKE